VTRLRASTHIERVALTLTTLAAFYAIWLGIGLPGLAPGPASGGRTPDGSVVVSQLGAHPHAAQRLVQRPALHAATVRTRTRLVSATSQPVVVAAPAAPVTAPPPAQAAAPPDRQPAATPLPVAPPPPPAAPGATTPSEPQLPQAPPSTTPTDVVQSVAATAQPAVDTAVDALPPVPDVPDVGSLVPSLSR